MRRSASLLPSPSGCAWMLAGRGFINMRILGIVALGAALGGCAVVARIEDRQEYVKARQQYEESTGTYRSCLGANQANPRMCEAQRLAMETDERAFNNISGHAANINVQQR
jgi:hypothetical protein